LSLPDEPPCRLRYDFLHVHCHVLCPSSPVISCFHFIMAGHFFQVRTSSLLLRCTLTLPAGHQADGRCAVPDLPAFSLSPWPDAAAPPGWRHTAESLLCP